MIKIRSKKQPPIRPFSYAVDIVKFGRKNVLTFKFHGCKLQLFFLLKNLKPESIDEVLLNIKNKIGCDAYDKLMPAYMNDSATILKYIRSKYNSVHPDMFNLRIDVAIAREYLYPKKNITQENLIEAMDYVNRDFRYSDSGKSAYELAIAEINSGNKDLLKLINAIGLKL